MEKDQCRVLDNGVKDQLTRSLRNFEEKDLFNNLERIGKALSDMNRIKIYYALNLTELCVCEISDLLNLPQSTVSGGLKELFNSGLIKRRRKGKWAYYSAVPQNMINLEVPLDEIQ